MARAELSCFDDFDAARRIERAQLLAFHEVYRGLKRRIELFMTVAEKAHPAAG